MEDPRQTLLRRLHAQEPYQFLTLAEPYIAEASEDHYIRLMAAREYLQLGLIQPARELLADAAQFPEIASQIAALGPQLATLQSSSMEEQPLVACWDTNLRAWRDQGLSESILLDAWSTRRTNVEFHRDRSGAIQVRLRDKEGRWWWFPSLGRHEQVDQARPLPEGLGGSFPGPYLFDGVEHGEYFLRVYRATHRTFLGFSCALFIVEPDPGMIAVLFHLRDWSEIIADRRVSWIIGESWREQLRALWNDEPDLPLPRQAFSHAAPCRPRTDALRIIEDESAKREDQIQQSLDALNQRYRGRDIAYWAGRFAKARGSDQGLRILSAVSMHTTFLKHSFRDAQHSLLRMGHSCTLLTEKEPHHVVGALTQLRSMLDLDPDVFLAPDHLRPEFGALLPARLPILTWDQDQLPSVFTKENMGGVALHDFIAGCGKSRWVHAGRDPKQFLHARVPTCPNRFDGDLVSPSEIEKYSCDVSFVSHASQTPAQFHAQQRDSCSDPMLARVLDKVFELAPDALRESPVAGACVADRLLEEACRRCQTRIIDPEVVSRLRNWYLWRLGDRIFRHEALEWVASWARESGRRFRLYGNGWDQHPTLSDFAAGPAENGRELLCIYRASKINLQLMPAGFIHQRALDGLSAGGFFLTRFVPSDLRGKAIHRLALRVHEIGVTTAQLLAETNDPIVARCMAELRGEWIEAAWNRMRQPGTGSQLVASDLDDLRLPLEIDLAAELEYPDEVFEDFESIVFRTRDEFRNRAEYFLAHVQEREELTKKMQSVVRTRFSYDATMSRILDAMSHYLSEAATTATQR